VSLLRRTPHRRGSPPQDRLISPTSSNLWPRVPVAMWSIDDQAKHDLRWVGIWALTTLLLAILARFFPVPGGLPRPLLPAASCTSMAWPASSHGETASHKLNAMTKTTDDVRPMTSIPGGPLRHPAWKGLRPDLRDLSQIVLPAP
jgi:hypothetical protein